MKIKQLATIVIISVFALTAQAQRTSVEAKIDSSAMFIGQQATLTIEARQPRNLHVQFPIFSDTVTGKLELVETPAPDTTPLTDDFIKVSQRYIVTAFDSALIYMPGFALTVDDDTIITNPLNIKIYDMPVDTTQQAITDIKGIYKPPFDWMRLLTIAAICLLAAILIAGLIYVIYRLRKNRVEPETPKETVDQRSAYEIAIYELNQLKERRLWQNGHNKEYHTCISDIIRQYISRRFKINAMEQSSEEILDAFRTDKSLRELKEESSLLNSILRLADLVKFAKMAPLATDNERIIKEATQFVELTKEPTATTDSPSATSTTTSPTDTTHTATTATTSTTK